MTEVLPVHADDDANEDEDVTATPVKIRASRSLCQGWGNCHRWAPDVYFLDDEGYEIGFQHLEVPGELLRSAWHGADACPEHAIQVLAPRPASDDSPS